MSDLLQKSIPVLGLFAILLVGITVPAMAENYDENKWDEKYRELEEEFDQKRMSIDEQFQDEFEELDRYYDEQKMEIYNKIESDSSLSDFDVDKMFDELFREFDEKRYNLEMEMYSQFEELDRMFEEELENIDNEYRNFEEHDRYDYDDYYYDDKYDEKDYDEVIESDPEWESIKPLKDRILDAIPMEKIQRLWEAGEINSLIQLIVSETDLTEEEAKRVVVFFERYDNRDYDRDYEHDYKGYDIEPYYPDRDYDNSQIQLLEQRIAELEEENRDLQDYISELEQEILEINAVVMEQVKYIYEWALSQ